jgi:hypothetical protein
LRRGTARGEHEKEERCKCARHIRTISHS